MKVYTYWARGYAHFDDADRSWPVVCFGASNDSLEEASAVATRKAETVKEAIVRGDKLERYSYTDRPLREELKREVQQDGELTAVITRNRYGALVLCTAKVMFIDIDVIEEDYRMPWPGFWNWLLRRKPKERPDPVADQPERLNEIREKAREHGIGLRVYRTPNGYRGLVTSRTFEPDSEETLALLRDFGSDDLYVKLCRVQECFRARLTPKPYRMRMRRPFYDYPWEKPSHEAKYRAWERAYENRTKEYSACRFVEHFGTLSIAREVRQIVEIHDGISCTGNTLA
jgi:hypothetical protein